MLHTMLHRSGLRFQIAIFVATCLLGEVFPAFGSSQEREESTAARRLSGEAVWARGFEGDLIRGCDGNLYPAYAPRVVRHVQTLLARRGVYGGRASGVLDRSTMVAIAEFQDATGVLHVSGVPTPWTRALLEHGSHSEVAIE